MGFFSLLFLLSCSPITTNNNLKVIVCNLSNFSVIYNGGGSSIIITHSWPEKKSPFEFNPYLYYRHRAVHKSGIPPIH